MKSRTERDTIREFIFHILALLVTAAWYLRWMDVCGTAAPRSRRFYNKILDSEPRRLTDDDQNDDDDDDNSLVLLCTVFYHASTPSRGFEGAHQNVLLFEGFSVRNVRFTLLAI